MSLLLHKVFIKCTNCYNMPKENKNVEIHVLQYLREKLDAQFINLIICRSNKPMALLLSYNFDLCTSKGNINVSAIYLWSFLVQYYIGRGLHRLLAASADFHIAFISLFASTCSQSTTRR